MTQLYIVEIQQYTNGEYGHIVHWAFDEDPDAATLKAESKYYEVLSAAAVSKLPSHAAILFSAEGFPLMNKCYKHDVPIIPDQAQEEPVEDIPEEPEENDLPQDDTPADPGDDEPGGPDVSEQEEPEETEGE